LGLNQKVHTTGNKSHPFSAREAFSLFVFPLACLFDSLVRVSRRVKAPHFHCVFANIELIPGEAPNLLVATSSFRQEARQCPTLSLRSLCAARLLHLVWHARRFLRSSTREMPSGWLWPGSKMEVLSLSLSRLQVLCHSLSKVLFKLSLTLLVCYRSSHFVFNLGRHIPAD